MSAQSATAIVGGGLAGLAAAVALRSQGVTVELFEARRSLGGRASSFRDAQTGEMIDYCQHVSMGCCANLADFCARAGIAELFHRYRVLHFIGPDGRQYDLAARRGLPAPAHLLPALWGLKFFSRRERVSLLHALWRLARWRGRHDTQTMAQWLATQSQSPALVEGFWAVVLVSALGETLDRVSVSAARKVFVDGFMTTTDGYEILVPQVPLGELYGARLTQRLTAQGVRLHLQSPVARVTGDAQQATGLELADGSRRNFDAVILAVPWRRVGNLLPELMRARVPLAAAESLESSPITGVHLWFHRPIMDLPHAVLISQLGDWVFAAGRGPVPGSACVDGHYYQVVISASRHLAGRPRDELVAELVAQLQATFPAAQKTRLLHAQVVTEKHAVFSPLPGSEAARPPQRTTIAGLSLAGDWTATGWPATMESAVRSGYLAAEAVLSAQGQPARLLVPEPCRGRLARWLF